MSVVKKVTAVESGDAVNVTIPKPSLRYLDLFMTLRCAPDLLKAEVYPNAKEITESFGAFFAAKRLYSPGSPEVTAIIVGDGRTPRTGALFAFMSKWNVVSVDPALDKWDVQQQGRWIDRLLIIPHKIEDVVTGESPGLELYGPVVIVCVHTHVELPVVLRSIKAPRRSLVTIGCCVPQELPLAPDSEYENWAIWSPQRTVKVWKSV